MYVFVYIHKPESTSSLGQTSLFNTALSTEHKDSEAEMIEIKYLSQYRKNRKRKHTEGSAVNKKAATPCTVKLGTQNEGKSSTLI